MSKMSDLIAGRDLNYQYRRAKKLYGLADASRWQVAAIAYKTVGAREFGATERLADAIGRSTDVVENLAKAYRLFVILLDSDLGRNRARELRRKHPYTRFLTVFEAWQEYEFSVEDIIDWLENFEGGNKALAAEIENKHGAPEWERRAHATYRQAQKMVNDFGAPKALQDAALMFVEAVDEYWRAHG